MFSYYKYRLDTKKTLTMKIATERNKIVNISPTRRPICLKQMDAIFETDPKIWSAPAGENVPNGRTHAIKKKLGTISWIAVLLDTLSSIHNFMPWIPWFIRIQRALRVYSAVFSPPLRHRREGCAIDRVFLCISFVCEQENSKS